MFRNRSRRSIEVWLNVEPVTAPPRDYGLKATPEDFLVFERLDWDALGLLLPDPVTAPQRLLLIEKRNLNTLDLIPPLARLLNVDPVEIGYAGRKDRRAVTRQWLTVPNRTSKEVAGVAQEALAAALASAGDGSSDRDLGADTNAPDTAGASARLLMMIGCRKKLRIGGLRGNRFRLQVGLPDALEPRRLEAALHRLQRNGVPNRFGAQRVNDAAVRDAWRVLTQRRAPRARRGWALSVLRSFLFNEVLAARLAAGPVTDGDGPLWGRGRNPASAAVVEFEAAVLEPHGSLLSRLEHAGLTQARRALIMAADELRWQRRGNRLELSFALPAGCYATVLVETLLDSCFEENRSKENGSKEGRSKEGRDQNGPRPGAAGAMEQPTAMAAHAPTAPTTEAVVYPWQQDSAQ